jgi:hypothetical protein
MTTVEQSSNWTWVLLMSLSLILLVITILIFLSGSTILEEQLRLAGSSMDLTDFDDAALGTLVMAMRKPLWEEVWIAVLGVYCALGLRQRKQHAWTLGLVWGIMLIVNGAIQGSYEVFALDWPYPCFHTYLFLGLGTIATVALLVSRRAARKS